MPDSHPPDGRRPARSAADRSLDHAAIDRLTSELLPSLVAKLGATGLGEIEVREGTWRVRLRRPADGTGTATVVHGRERRPGERPATDRGGDRGDRHADRPRPLHHGGDGSAARADVRRVATSPAVGVFQPRRDLSAGDRVRAGDRLGAVDMLGVAQEVLAPVDGVLGASLVEPGDAVEYGQELFVIETAGSVGSGGPADGAA